MRALLLISAVIVLCSAQLPIPPLRPGHVFGNPNGAVELEAFFDHLCPDSRDSWVTVKQVFQYYAKTLRGVVHIFPLPYHHNGFYAAQGGLVISETWNDTTWWEYLDLMFANQETYYNDATADMSANDVINSLAQLVQTNIGFPKSVFVTGMTYGNQFDADARSYWKFGAARGMYGTPLFFLNGVLINADSTWTLSQWQSLINTIPGVGSVSSKHDL